MNLYSATRDSYHKTVDTHDEAIKVIASNGTANDVFVVEGAHAYTVLVTAYGAIVTPERLRRYHREVFRTDMMTALFPVLVIVLLAIFLPNDVNARPIVNGSLIAAVFAALLVWWRRAKALRVAAFVTNTVNEIEQTLKAKGLQENKL
jgi:hypothetical protein